METAPAAAATAAPAGAAGRDEAPVPRLEPAGIQQARAEGQRQLTVTQWSTLINPGVPIPNAAVHGIDERLAAAAPSFSAVVPTLAALLEGRVLVAHNLDRDCLRGQSLSIGMDEHRSGLRQEEDAGDLLRIAAGEFGHHQAPIARLSEVPWQSLEAGVAAFEPGFALNREQPEQQQRPEIAQQS